MKKELIIIPVILVLFIALGVMVYVPERKIAESFMEIFSLFGATTKTLIVLAGIGASMALVAGLGWLLWVAAQSGIIWRSQARLASAAALQAERDASLIITVAQPGSQVFASEVSGKLQLVHKPLHLSPGRVNGLQVEPTLNEVRRWSFFQLTQSISHKPEIAIEEVPQIQAPIPDHVELSQYVNGQTSLRNIFLGVGRMPDGQVRPINAPLNRLVHVAVAGSSGFGKSTFMQSLGYQVLNAKENPSTVMLDSQGVTFTPFDGHGNLLFPLASGEDDIRAVLSELVNEMTRRQQLFSKWRGVDSLERYNSVVAESERLSVLIIFFDEFGLVADDKPIAAHIRRLAQGGRKFGMYLIAGSQTWYSDDIASSLKANLSTSIQFYAKSKSQSRVLLGNSAAFEITRPGQAFCRLPGQAGLIELQAPDVKSVVEVTPTLLEADEMRSMPHQEPTEQEQQILELYRNGATLNGIARQVFGSIGGKQNQLIKDILSKFNEN